jgi:hypothetical protein
MTGYVLHDARTLCAELGATPDDIAKRLSELGHCGKRRDRKDCPIFRFLTQHLPGFEWRDTLPMHFPGPVGDFILTFDRGGYPFLDEDLRDRSV